MQKPSVARTLLRGRRSALSMSAAPNLAIADLLRNFALGRTPRILSIQSVIPSMVAVATHPNQIAEPAAVSANATLATTSLGQTLVSVSK